MMPAVRHVIHNHLKSLELLPVPITMRADDMRMVNSAQSPWSTKVFDKYTHSDYGNYSGYTFQLAPDMESSLYYRQQDEGTWNMVMVTAMDRHSHSAHSVENSDLFAVSINPVISPLLLVNAAEYMALRLVACTDYSLLTDVLDESIVWMRRIVGAVFTAMIALEKKQCGVSEAINNVFKSVQPSRNHI